LEGSLKAKIKGVSSAYTTPMVTYNDRKMTYSPMLGHLLDTITSEATEKSGSINLSK